MPRGVDISVERWAEFITLRRNGMGRAHAGRKTGIGEQSAYLCETGRRVSKNYAEAVEQIDRMGSAKVLAEHDLPDAVREAYDSIEVFSLRYFGIVLQPWQVQVAEEVERLLATPEEEYLLSNAPPGSGKSTFFSKILPAYVTVRNRGIRGMLGSSTMKLAEWYTRALRAEFEREHEVKAELNDIRLGLAQDGLSTLARDFGAFKPEHSDLWRSDQFTVSQVGDTDLNNKEPTWSAFGRDTGFLGGRFDFVVWDDVWDPTKLRTAEAREAFFKWWDEVAETRLEPGGLMVLNMQRMSADDISHHVLDKVVYPEDYDDDEPESVGELGSEESSEQADDPSLLDATSLTDPASSSLAPETDDAGLERMWRHLKFKAHYEENCTGQHRRDSPPWPEGCLLAPRRVTWRKLRQVKASSPERYEIIYQQEDTDPAHVLVNPVWVSGGTDPKTGIHHLGCWDSDRDLWELPPNLDGTPIIIAAADPSPSKFWALQTWAVVPETGFRYLLESYRRKMDAPSFLDWDHQQGEFVGVAEEWHHICMEKLGRKIDYWVFEQNAAQKFVTQYNHWQRWSAMRGVELIPHQTNLNKTDPQYGVQMLKGPWRHGLVRLPGKQGGSARFHSLLLVNEVTKWTVDRTHGGTDDQVMAQWFIEHNLENLYTPSEAPPRQARPSWLTG